MTNMKKMQEGIISATLGLKDMLEAEEGTNVHFLTKSEYDEINEMISNLCYLFERSQVRNYRRGEYGD